MPRPPKPSCCGSSSTMGRRLCSNSGAPSRTWKQSFYRSSKEETDMASMPRTLSTNQQAGVSASALARLAGPLALAAGILITVQQLVMYPILDHSQLMATMAHPLFVPSAIAYLVAFCALLIALAAVYEWQAGRTGVLGAIG